MKRLTCLICAVASCTLPPLAEAHAPRLRHQDVLRAAVAYARSVDRASAKIDCHRNHCRITQTIHGGEWDGWTETYAITVTRLGPHLLKAANSFMKPDIYIRV